MSKIKNGGLDLDGTDHFCKCNPLMPLGRHFKAGLSNLSAMACRIDLILGVAGHYAI